MAITETRALPAQFIEDLGKDYAKQLTSATAAPLDTSKFVPSVAAQDALQQQATALTTSGIGSYQPFVTAAQQAAGTALTGAQTGLGAIGAQYADPARAGVVGAQTTLGGVSPYITAAQQAGTTAGTGLGLAQTGLGIAGQE